MKKARHIYAERHAETPLEALDTADTLIFDSRNLFEPKDIKAISIEHHGIGRYA